MGRTAIQTTLGSSEASGETTWRLRVALFVAPVITLLVFLGIARLDYDQIRAEALAEANVTLTLLHDHLLGVLEADDQVLRQADRRIQGLAWSDIRAGRQTVAADLAALVAQRPEVATLSLADGTGRTWVGVGSGDIALPPDGLDVSGQAFWARQRDADRDTLIARLETGRNERPILTISRRRTVAGGGFDGTVQLAIPVSSFLRYWETAVHGKAGAVISLLDGNGQSLTRSTPIPPSGTGESIQVVSRIAVYNLGISLDTPMAPVMKTWRRHLLIPGGVCLAAGLLLTMTLAMAMRIARSLEKLRSCRLSAERVALESQKREILGQLAAGVAHDFGNVMQAVTASAGAIPGATDNDRVRQIARRISDAAVHGRSLTERMLDLARGNASSAADGDEPVLAPHETVSEACGLLSDTLGPRYQVRFEADLNNLPERVSGERSGLAVAIMNLALNARDAMADGGDIVVRLAGERIPSLAVIGDHPAAPDGVAPGLYARISVTDSGAGMSPAVLARAAEPFFTTKPPGSGTGLGLAGARRFALAAGGGFHIHSVQHVGTTVTLWLPAVAVQDTDAQGWVPDPAMTQL